MKFSGKGPNLKAAVQAEMTGGGELVELFNDKAADWPWDHTEDGITACTGSVGVCQHEPRVGQKCASESCQRPFVKGQMVYLTIETDAWVCWRHVGISEPVKAEPL
jgi:hypothetical protein